VTVSETRRAIDAVWRIESARLIAGLARMVRDVGVAEELAQDALVAALEQWPESGVPRNPGAWLMTVAKRRAIDLIRRNARLERKLGELGHELEVDGAAPDPGAVPPDHIEDDLLRLIFTACHPVLSADARVALTLRLLGGLTTEEIARAFLVPEPTVAQRIVRAKRTLGKAGVAFEVPEAGERAARLSTVLEVVYLVFNEGYTATAGEDWLRPALCEEALRLGRILAGLVPGEPEVHGLLALMEIQASRIRARTGPSGEPILLLDQDRTRWDRLLVRRGLAALERAEALAATRGPYALQAAIAACHARAGRPEETDWVRIAALYAALARVVPSPVVQLNRAVALSMAFGPATGLELVDRLTAEPALAAYHLLPSVRGDLLARLDRPDEARAEFVCAAALARNGRERALLTARAAACGEAASARAVAGGAVTGHPSEGAREFELRRDLALDATPEQVWEAIATGPGVTAWFLPHEVEPGAGGVVRLRLGEFVDESTITGWAPPHRLTVVSGPPDAQHTFEYRVEAGATGGAVLRFVQRGVLGGDREAEYQALGAGWDLYLHTLAQYLAHFPGRRATFVGADGPAASASQRAWPVLLAALGLDGPPVVGERVRLTGPEPIEGVADYVTPQYLGVRTTDGLYRFHGRAALGMTIAAGHHLYTAGVDAEQAGKAWRSWFESVFSA
jgi:RNA polymerase sigma-70 factor (ECF subfamily)